MEDEEPWGLKAIKLYSNCMKSYNLCRTPFGSRMHKVKSTPEIISFSCDHSILSIGMPSNVHEQNVADLNK